MLSLRNLILGLLVACLLLPAVVLAETPETVVSDHQVNDYAELELFTDVLALIHRSYVEQVDIRDLIYGGIRGMLATLDPHSSFLTPELYAELQADTHGEFGGVGIEVSLEKGLLTVVAPIEGTPAQRAGIRARDRIVQIDTKPTRDLNLLEAVRMMRGSIGEELRLGIRRADTDRLLEFNLMRELIQVQSVSGRILEPNYAYVRISQFQERTAADLKGLLSELRDSSSGQLKGLIVDLRNNPGGLLDQAVAVSDLFLNQGLIVYTEGRSQQDQLRFQASAEGTEPNYPLVLLINEGSASAAEIVAGALHDHGRALLLGVKTFGKGSVQTVIPLSDDSGLRLTTARYFTPQGISIQARGITPDIEVPNLELDTQTLAGHYREQDLDNHFEPEPEAHGATEQTPLQLSERRDFQLLRALDLLKGLEYFQMIGNR